MLVQNDGDDVNGFEILGELERGKGCGSDLSIAAHHHWRAGRLLDIVGYLGSNLVDAGQDAEIGGAGRLGDGGWDRAYKSCKDMLPRDLHATIDADPEARGMLGRLSEQNRFALAFCT